MERMGEFDSAVAVRNQPVGSSMHDIQGRRISLPCLPPVSLATVLIPCMRGQPVFNRLYARLERAHRTESGMATLIVSTRLRRQPWKT